ncbi:MAG TPA: hypothetical protein VM008_11685 [Phycisphaerae bacterium]|nr:hypothetical protein [Phycisphaerae bacterium]
MAAGVNHGPVAALGDVILGIVGEADRGPAAEDLSGGTGGGRDVAVGGKIEKGDSAGVGGESAETKVEDACGAIAVGETDDVGADIEGGAGEGLIVGGVGAGEEKLSVAGAPEAGVGAAEGEGRTGIDDVVDRRAGLGKVEIENAVLNGGGAGVGIGAAENNGAEAGFGQAAAAGDDAVVGEGNTGGRIDGGVAGREGDAAIGT